ncbi:MaoC family dehydratase [Noviherbaspirillum sp.]|jgi:hypothetical protein|uniref:MaoC family dehydratase n=1 Tax=Noviherbaspirillum sp. TaxID=1926288 RepID=UPI0025DEA0FD|nr:MaoC family dehydratase [Noviherbaspirillum sp.]HJV54222.1 MaoC family dehydratase [Noviherbaspirillum sp.]
MKANTHLRFTRQPSLGDLFLALMRNSRQGRRNPQNALHLRASWHDIGVDPAHRSAFHAACHLPDNSDVSILYPMAWVYPPMLHMLSHGAAPMPLFRALNTRITIRQHHPLPADARPDVELAAQAVRRVEKGLEFDIGAEVRVDGVLTWESRITMFYRGRFDGSPDSSPSQPDPRVESGDASHAWHLPAKDRFRFGRLCGDTNPLHYGKAYAKVFGFERDFAQPLLVIGQALSRLPDYRAAGPSRLEARLKGPVYYERNLKMLVQGIDGGHRFDVYCEPNTRPSLCVELGGAPDRTAL